jgi:hypothetical protein
VLGGDLINLKIKPEVSSLDFNNAVILEGFRIPALTSRRAETEVELQDGQTFAIAGLLNNTALSSMRKVPGLGDIPVLGLLFKSRAYQKDQTELVVMVTPTIVRKGSTGVSQGLPTLVEPYMGPNERPLPSPDPYVGSPVYPVRGGGNAPAPAAAQPPANRPAVQNPVPSTSIQGPATMPTAPAAAPAMTEKQRKAAAEEEERKAEEARIAAKKAEEDRKKMERIEKERAKQQAEADRKAADAAEKAARKKLEEDRKKAAEAEKRDKALAEAAARLKQAQSAYQAEVAKTSKGGGK